MKSRQTIPVAPELTTDQTGYLIKLIEWYLKTAILVEGKPKGEDEQAFVKRILTKLKRAEREAYSNLGK